MRSAKWSMSCWTIITHTFDMYDIFSYIYHKKSTIHVGKWPKCMGNWRYVTRTWICLIQVWFFEWIAPPHFITILRHHWKGEYFWCTFSKSKLYDSSLLPSKNRSCESSFPAAVFFFPHLFFLLNLKHEKSRPNKAESCQRLENNGLPGKTGWKELHGFFLDEKHSWKLFFLFFVQGKPTRSKDVQAAFFVVKHDKEIVKKPTSVTELFPHTSSYSLYNHPVRL